MTAETLRRAAALMRERAKSASVWDGYWQVHPKRPGRVIEDKHGNGWDDAIIASCIDYGGAENGTGQAAHIASWHPAVALAVADWLLVQARLLEATGHGNEDPSRCACLEPFSDALAVARAYLGEEA